MVARWEAGQATDGATRVLRAVEAAGAELALALPAVRPDALHERYLQTSTSVRLRYSLHHDPAVLEALDRAAHRRIVVLEPAARLGVWLPDCLAPAPVPVVMLALQSRFGPQFDHPWQDVPELQVTVGPVSIAGLVPVGVGPRSEVLVHPPDHPLMALDPFLSARLRGVAQLLDGQAPRDRAERRTAAHRDSDVVREYEIVMSRLRFKHVQAPNPSPLERRDWRLGGEASFDQWLARRGFPHLRG